MLLTDLTNIVLPVKIVKPVKDIFILLYILLKQKTNRIKGAPT